MHPKLMSNEQIGIIKSSKNGHVCAWKLPQIKILQVDFLTPRNPDIMVEKKSEFVADLTFSRYKAEILPTGVIDPEKRLVAQFCGFEASVDR